MFGTLTHGIWFHYLEEISVYWNLADSFEVYEGEEKIDGFAVAEKPKNNKKPILGICLGMQMMFDFSCEFKNTKGLGLIEGNVQKLPENETLKSKFKIPNIGWYKLINNTNNNKISFFENNYSFYFVHSFSCIPDKEELILAYFEYDKNFVASIAKENVVGTQFHPEKSLPSGLKILKNFIVIEKFSY